MSTGFASTWSPPENDTRRVTISDALPASDAITRSSRSTAEYGSSASTERAILVMVANGACSSFTTPEINRPTAASFSVRKSCSRTER